MAEQLHLIQLDKVKKLTGATTDEQAAMQSRTIEQVIENYTGLTLFKRTIVRERITFPYGLQKVFRPSCLPVNSVEKVILGEKIYTGNIICGTYGVELAENPHVKPQISAIEITYNAGLYDALEDIPVILTFVAEKLLYWFFVTKEAAGGFQSEHIGDYSYTKGTFVCGIPQEIAHILDSMRLV